MVSRTNPDSRDRDLLRTEETRQKTLERTGAKESNNLTLANLYFVFEAFLSGNT